MRHRHRTRGSQGADSSFQLPTTMTDLTFCLLLTFLVCGPEFLDSIRLPALVVAPENAPRNVVPGEEPLSVVLPRTGQLRCENQPIASDELLRRLAEPAWQHRPLQLFVEVDAEGQGATQSLLHLQVALDRAGMLSRVRLKFTSPAESSGDTP